MLLEGHIRVSYAFNGARDNPEMGGFNSRSKMESRLLLLDAQNLELLQLVVRLRVANHNRGRRHSAIGYLVPATYVKHHVKHQSLWS